MSDQYPINSKAAVHARVDWFNVNVTGAVVAGSRQQMLPNGCRIGQGRLMAAGHKRRLHRLSLKRSL